MSQQLGDMHESIVQAQTKLEGKEEDKEKSSANDWVKNIKFYYAPLIILCVFFALVRFGVYGAISSTFDNLTKIDKLQEDVTRQNETIKTLDELRKKSGDTKNYLFYINRIVPIEQTNVSNYQTSIRNIALLNNLNVREARSGEEILANSEDVEAKLQLIQVPTTFQIEGGFESIKKFLTDIYNGDDFIIIEEMSFSKDAASDRWAMEIVFVKYQFIENDGNQEVTVYDEYLRVPETIRADKFVIEFLENKYIKDNTAVNVDNSVNTQPSESDTFNLNILGN